MLFQVLYHSQFQELVPAPIDWALNFFKFFIWKYAPPRWCPRTSGLFTTNLSIGLAGAEVINQLRLTKS